MTIPPTPHAPMVRTCDETLEVCWVDDQTGERTCSRCYTLGHNHLVDGELLCSFCLWHNTKPAARARA